MEEMKSLPACSPHYPWRKLFLFTELQRKEPAFPESHRQMRARDRDRLKTSRLLLRRGGEGRLLLHLQESSCSPRSFPAFYSYTRHHSDSIKCALWGFYHISLNEPIKLRTQQEEDFPFLLIFGPLSVQRLCDMKILYLSKENFKVNPFQSTNLELHFTPNILESRTKYLMEKKERCCILFIIS